MATIPEQVSQAWEKREGPIVLATVDGDGTPNAIWATCVALYGKDRVVIADNYFDKTRRNLQAGCRGADPGRNGSGEADFGAAQGMHGGFPADGAHNGGRVEFRCLRTVGCPKLVPQFFIVHAHGFSSFPGRRSSRMAGSTGRNRASRRSWTRGSRGRIAASLNAPVGFWVQ